MDSAENQQGSWIRSKNIRTDMLHLFLTGEMFDCSFKVGKTPETSQVFKCHKLVLSTVSSVFQAMLFGHFREANKSPDDPINLDITTPEVFETSMRYIYGDEQAFDTLHTIQVFAFAHRMQITSLMAATEESLMKNCRLKNVMVIYDIYKVTGTDVPEVCKACVMQDTKAALDTKFWLKVSADTVESILQLDEISIEEIDIFRALVRWGKAQVESDGAAEDPEEILLRAKIDQFLKLIRFESLTSKHAAEVCSTTKIFSPDEQRCLLLSTVLNELKYLPQNLFVQQKRPARVTCVAVPISYSNCDFHILSPSDIFFKFKLKRKSQLYEFSLSKSFRHLFYTPKNICLFDKKSGAQISKFRFQPGNIYTLHEGSSILNRDHEYYLVFSAVDKLCESFKPTSACGPASAVNKKYTPLVEFVFGDLPVTELKLRLR